MDSMSWHQDDEKEMGKNPIIASVNFGATRQFEMRHIQTKEKIKFDLEHGSLLIMLGETQHYWQHQLPKLKRPLGSRINLTYRLMK
jgi:alkylated DNA repair dioxygenase AlkB